MTILVSVSVEYIVGSSGSRSECLLVFYWLIVVYGNIRVFIQ